MKPAHEYGMEVREAARPARVGRRPPLGAGAMWAAFLRRDRRYDGRFVAAVRSTRVFCRPTCTCRKPRRDRVVFFPTPEAAERAGFRPCKRCRPEIPGGAAGAERRLAQRAVEVMRARLDEPWTLPALAAELAMSPSGFARRFRAATGETPMRALADLRAERAAALLRETDRAALEIALDAGFGSYAALTRAFLRRHGCSVSEWRRRGRRKRRAGAG
jgi:methylphosphotriester-DNA--protein-cysteine methyltransferase